MNKIVRASIVFDFYPDEDPFIAEENLSDDELMSHFQRVMYEDISSFYKYNELLDVINVEIVNENN